MEWKWSGNELETEWKWNGNRMEVECNWNGNGNIMKKSPGKLMTA